MILDKGKLYFENNDIVTIQINKKQIRLIAVKKPLSGKCKDCYFENCCNDKLKSFCKNTILQENK